MAPAQHRSSCPCFGLRYRDGVIRLLALTPLAVLLGCASVWQGVYAGAAATADYVDKTHERGWSAPLRIRVAECDADLPEGATAEQVDVCLGPYAANAEVVAALETYNAAADVLAATLLATDPSGDQTDVLVAWGDVLAAARAFVALLPDGERYLRQLDALTRRTRKA